ncbi:MAG: hypothetical protein ACTSYM_11475 [Candidatus Baldrarchaeia archaeon]
MLVHRIGSQIAVSTKSIGLILIIAFLSISSSFELKEPEKPVVGIYYNYLQDNTAEIICTLHRMKEIGFQIISIPILWNDDPTDPLRVKNEVFYSTAIRLGFKIYVREPWNLDIYTKYLSEYGDKISYVQIINEADVKFLKEWYVPGELVSIACENAKIAKKINPNIKTVASFATPLFIPLIRDISEYADIIALDIYEDIQFYTFPIQIQMMLTASGKQNIWIGELGCATPNDQEQADFLIKVLDLCKKNGIEAAIIWVWHDNLGLKIKDRQAETEIANWIKNN